MDKESDFESEDCEFDPHHVRIYFASKKTQFCKQLLFHVRGIGCINNGYYIFGQVSGATINWLKYEMRPEVDCRWSISGVFHWVWTRRVVKLRNICQDEVARLICSYIDIIQSIPEHLITINLITLFPRPCGPMDKASEFESEDCGFDPHHVCKFFASKETQFWNNYCFTWGGIGCIKKGYYIFGQVSVATINWFKYEVRPELDCRWSISGVCHWVWTRSVVKLRNIC